MVEFNLKITMKILLVLHLTLGFLIGRTDFATGQDTNAILLPADVMSELNLLKNGVLIVRLESNQRKITAMEQLVEQKGGSTKQQQKLREQLEDTKLKTHNQIEGYLQAFKKNYRFSDVVFMYDYQTPEYKKGDITFFDVNRTQMSGSEVLSRHCVVLSQGLSDFNRAKVLEFMTRDLKRLGKPAPKSHFGVFSFFTSTDLRILRLNRKLETLIP